MAICVSSLEKKVYSVPLPIFFFLSFFFLMLRCMSFLCINPLLDTSFANILFHSVFCFFVLLIVSFAVPQLFNLIRSHLFIFAFVSLA